MVSDTYVHKAACDTCLGHLTDSILAITPGRMNMQHASQVALLHQFRKSTMSSCFDLSHIFTQLRFDIGQTKCRVDIGFILTWDELQVWFFSLKETIVVDGHVHTQGAAPQGNMVFFGTCKVVEGIGKLA